MRPMSSAQACSATAAALASSAAGGWRRIRPRALDWLELAAATARFELLWVSVEAAGVGEKG